MTTPNLTNLGPGTTRPDGVLRPPPLPAQVVIDIQPTDAPMVPINEKATQSQ